jgi:dTDP-glucose 4,6-dehydratase
MPVLELAKYIRTASGSTQEIVHRPLPEDDPKQRRPDITRARTALGWEPKVPFDQGLQRTLDYFRSVV